MREKLLNVIFRVIYSSILSLATLSTGAQAEPLVVSRSRDEALKSGRTTLILTISANKMLVGNDLTATEKTSATKGRGGATTLAITGGSDLTTINPHSSLITGPGTGVVVLTTGDGCYHAASKSQTITIRQAAPELVITSPNAVAVDEVLTPTVKTTSEQDIGTISYNVLNGSGAALLNHNTGLITALRVGSITLTATSLGNTDYTSATASQLITISKGNPTLMITSVNALSVGDSLTAKGVTSASYSRGGSMSFSISGGSGSATIDPGTGLFKAISSGKVMLTATSFGDDDYNSAAASQEIIIHPAVPILTITSGKTLNVDNTLTAMVRTTATGGRGGAITFAISTNDGYATVDSHTGLVTAITAGAVTLTATSAGDSDYYPAVTSQQIMINPTTPTLAITSASVLNVDDILRVRVTSTATDGLGGAFRYDVTDGSGAAAVAPYKGLLKAISAGTVTLTVTSVGDNDYNPATTSQQITIYPATPVLMITSVDTLAVDGTMTATVRTTATHRRGGAITFAISTDDGYATVNSHTGLITGISAGAVTLTVTSAGDSDYNSVTASQRIMIKKTTPILKISSGSVLDVDGILRVRVTSTATDGLGGAFRYDVTDGTGSATVDSDTGLLKAISAGTVTLTVNSVGDSDYNAATTSQQITIYPAAPVLMITSVDTLAVDETMMATVKTTATGGRGGAVTFAISTNDGYATVNLHTGLITGITAGAVTLTATSAGDSDYNSATVSQRIMIKRTTPILEIVSGNVLEVDGALRVRVTSTATDGLGGAFRYAVIGGSGSATVDSDTGLLTAIHAGTITLTVASAGDSDYYSVTINQKLTIHPRTPTLTITSDNALNVYGTLGVTATTDARGGQGGVITFIVSNGTGYAVVDPYTKLLVGVRAGTVMLMAVSKGDTDYNMAVASQLITINDTTVAKMEFTSSISDPIPAGPRVIIPQALSPNGDGFNDTFIIENIENYPDNEVVIANRKGEVVFKAQRYNNNAIIFTGKSSISGAELPEGIYYYTVMLYDQGESNKYVGYLKLRK